MGQAWELARGGMADAQPNDMKTRMSVGVRCKVRARLRGRGPAWRALTAHGGGHAGGAHQVVPAGRNHRQGGRRHGGWVWSSDPGRDARQHTQARPNPATTRRSRPVGSRADRPRQPHQCSAVTRGRGRTSRRPHAQAGAACRSHLQVPEVEVGVLGQQLARAAGAGKAAAAAHGAVHGCTTGAIRASGCGQVRAGHARGGRALQAQRRRAGWGLAPRRRGSPHRGAMRPRS